MISQLLQHKITMHGKCRQDMVLHNTSTSDGLGNHLEYVVFIHLLIAELSALRHELKLLESAD